LEVGVGGTRAAGSGLLASSSSPTPACRGVLLRPAWSLQQGRAPDAIPRTSGSALMPSISLGAIA